MTKRLFAPFAALLMPASACEPGPISSIEDRQDDGERRTLGSDVSPTTYLELERPVLVLGSSEFIEFKLGSTKFRAPRNRVGSCVDKNGNEVDYTTVNAYVPELLQRDSPLKRGDVVMISIQVRKDAPYKGVLNCFRHPNDGRIPFVTCSGSRNSSGWSCRSQGWLPPNIQVRYQFYEKQLQDWPDIDAAVFNLIDRYRMEKSSDSADEVR